LFDSAQRRRGILVIGVNSLNFILMIAGIGNLLSNRGFHFQQKAVIFLFCS
jgi:hypothetical protein